MGVWDPWNETMGSSEWGYENLGMRLWDPWNEIVRAWDRTNEIFPLQTYNLRDPSSVLKVVRNSNVVINLVGRDYETRSEPPVMREGGCLPVSSVHW